jgi:hypothetical protein
MWLPREENLPPLYLNLVRRPANVKFTTYRVINGPNLIFLWNGRRVAIGN